MKYNITVGRTVYERGILTVEAANEDEAAELADEMLCDDPEIEWNAFDADSNVASVEAAE